MAKQYICTVMTYTDGTVHTYAVLRGPMRGDIFLSGQADTVARHTLGKASDQTTRQ
jgi:hypothetical protein